MSLLLALFIANDTESITLTDTQTGLVASLETLSEAVTLTDAQIGVGTYLEDQSDLIALNDVQTGLLTYLVDQSEIIALTDAQTVLADYVSDQFESTALTEEQSVEVVTLTPIQLGILQGTCTVFRVNLLRGRENFTAISPYTYKIALYTEAANLNPSTLSYISAAEVVGSGYSAGGNVITPTAIIGQEVFFSTVSWTAALAARCALVYNDISKDAVMVIDFGSTMQSTTVFTVSNITLQLT